MRETEIFNVINTVIFVYFLKKLYQMQKAKRFWHTRFRLLVFKHVILIITSIEVKFFGSIPFWCGFFRSNTSELLKLERSVVLNKNVIEAFQRLFVCIFFFSSLSIFSKSLKLARELFSKWYVALYTLQVQLICALCICFKKSAWLNFVLFKIFTGAEMKTVPKYIFLIIQFLSSIKLKL